MRRVSISHVTGPVRVYQTPKFACHTPFATQIFIFSPEFLTQGAFYIILWFRIQHTDAGDRATGRLSKSWTTVNNIIFECVVEELCVTSEKYKSSLQEMWLKQYYWHYYTDSLLSNEYKKPDGFRFLPHGL